jgi:hypothetical protein
MGPSHAQVAGNVSEMACQIGALSPLARAPEAFRCDREITRFASAFFLAGAPDKSGSACGSVAIRGRDAGGQGCLVGEPVREPRGPRGVERSAVIGA